MEIKAIFFDQDNTIFNTSEVSKPAYQKALKYIADKNSISYDNLYNSWKRIVDQIKHSKDPSKRYFDYSLRLALKKNGLNLNYVQDGLRILEKEISEKVQLTKGTREFFNAKTDLEYILYTEDNESQSNIKVVKFKLLKHFSLRITSKDTNIMKPSIKYLEIAWKRFDLEPDECIYIGDNWTKDCQIGQELGGVGIVFNTKDARADYEIDDMRELLKIIEEIKQK